jgi:hypothetical protein
MSTINLVQGDTGPQIKTTITREDTGEVIDMSGGTVRLKVRKRGAATLAFTLTALDVGTNLQEGVAIFAFGSGDLDIDPGHYEGEIEITLSDSTVETVYETLEFFVREDF